MVWSRSPDGEFKTPQPDWSAFTGQGFAELQRTPYEIEHRVRRHDGEYRYMAARAVPIPAEGGGIREWAGLHIDEIEELLGLPVQVVVLNHAPVDLSIRVLRDGRLLVDRDRSKRVRFEVRTRFDFWDLEPYLKQYRRVGAQPR